MPPFIQKKALKNKRAKSASNVKRGRRNRQRGAELQRLLVNKCR